MSHFGPVLTLAAGLAVLPMVQAPPAIAANGMNMIGYGAESIAMGGADLALTASPSSMNINPAGIGRIEGRELAFAAGMMEPSLTHRDALGNHTGDALDRVPMPFLGYVHPVGDFTFGLGLFVQGGMGAEYQGLVTPFAARMGGAGGLQANLLSTNSVPPTDATLTHLAHAKLTPTVAWRAGNGLTLGVSLPVSYATADMQLFPSTSVRADLDGSGIPGDGPGDFFFGLDGQDVSGVGYGIRVGLQYERGALTIGSSYASMTDLDLDGGTMYMNLSALGLGRVAYDCRMSGLSWPQQAGLGFAYRIRPRVLVAADVDWVDWSGAISTVVIDLENPALAQAPAARQVPLRMGWRDQWVGAVGLQLERPRDWVLRLGFNHGRTPIPDAMLRPLFPAIAEDHVTAGVGLVRGPWIIDLAFEHALENHVTNDSRDPSVNPFGPGAQENLSQFGAHLMVRRAFAGRRGGAPPA